MAVPGPRLVLSATLDFFFYLLLVSDSLSLFLSHESHVTVSTVHYRTLKSEQCEFSADKGHARSQLRGEKHLFVLRATA